MSAVYAPELLWLLYSPQGMHADSAAHDAQLRTTCHRSSD